MSPTIDTAGSGFLFILGLNLTINSAARCCASVAEPPFPQIQTLPFFLIMMNLKASIAGIVAFYFLISYFDIFKKLFQKEYLIIFCIILFCILLIHVDNSFITNNYFNERDYEEEYNNKVQFNI